MFVSTEMIRQWFDYGILTLIDCTKVDPNLECVAVARQCEVDWVTFSSCDWLLYEYRTGKLSRVGSSMPTIRKLANVSQAKIDKTETIRLNYREKFATSGVMFHFARATRLQHRDKMMD